MTVALAIILLLQAMSHNSLSTSQREKPGHFGYHEDRHGRVFDPDGDAGSAIDKALSDARIGGKIVVIILGANWCHDSVGLAARLEAPRFAAMMRDRFEIVYVDIGKPQAGMGRNLDIAERFGINRLKSTPVVLLVSTDGKLLNSKKDAVSWRNAANRSEDRIFDYFSAFNAT